MRKRNTRKLRKLLACILIGSLVLAAAGCGGQGKAKSGADTTKTKTASGKKVEIRLAWWGDTKRNEIYNKVCDAFEKQNPDIKVMRESMSWTDYWTKLATQVGGDNGPDVFGMHPQYAADYALRGALLDLKPYVDDGTIDTTHMSDSVVESGKYADTLYMISQGITCAGFFVNKPLAKKYGVQLPESNADWTWDDMKEQALAFAKKAKGKNLYFACDCSNVVTSFRWYAREQGGDLYTKDGQLNFNEQDVENWLNYWTELRKAGAIPDTATTTEDAAVPLEQKIFTKGNSVLSTFPLNQLSLVQDAMPDNPLSVVRIPTSADGTHAEFVEGCYFGISSKIDKAHQKAAAKLINFFVNTKDGIKIFQMEQGVPANDEMAAYLEPMLSDINKFSIQYHKNLLKELKPAVYAPKGASEIDSLYATISQSVNYGQVSAKEGAKQFVQQAKEVLAKNK